jgi:hypothetical protein
LSSAHSPLFSIRALTIAIATLLLTFSPAVREAAAKAPPHATTIFPVEITAAPAMDAAVIGIAPAGLELELTGDAAPGYIAVYYDGEPAWVPAQYLSLGDRPGIDTAVAVTDTPLLDAPMREAVELGVVPEGGTVILTGAAVDGYDAASYESIGGWIDDRDLAR